MAQQGDDAQAEPCFSDSRYVSLDTLVPAPADADAELKVSGPLADELLDAEERMEKAVHGVPRAQLLEELLGGRGGSLNRHAAEVSEFGVQYSRPV